MTNLLLTGAGFSYNWGGPLASDVFAKLLGDKDLDADQMETAGFRPPLLFRWMPGSSPGMTN